MGNLIIWVLIIYFVGIKNILKLVRVVRAEISAAVDDLSAPAKK